MFRNSKREQALRRMLIFISYFRVTFTTDTVGLKHFHERGSTEDHWSGTLLETFVLTFTDFQSISVEAATCLSVMVHWIQPYAFMRAQRSTGQKPASQPASRAHKPVSSPLPLIETVNLYIIQLRASESQLAFLISQTDAVCFLSYT
jgi:hypothetical protein